MKLQLAIATVALAWNGSASAQNIKEMQLADAAQYCRTAEVADLLDQGADINARRSGYTALMLAAGNGCDAVVKLLLEKGADTSIKHPSFGDAAAQARMNQHPKLQEMIQAAGAPQLGPTAALVPPQKATNAPTAPPAAADVGGKGGSGWPKLGYYKAGQQVLYSGTGGKTWNRGTIKSIDPKYGYNIEGVTGSNDAFEVVSTDREPFWTGWFLGDWKVSVPMAMGTVTDGRYLYRTVSGGMRLPPLRIKSDGTYAWRVQSRSGEKLFQGRWEPSPTGPGVILKNAEAGADWLVYNNSDTGSSLGETIIISSDCCSHYDGSRLR